MIFLAKSEDLVVQNSKDEVLIYDLKKNKAICLNQTSAMIWELCDGKRSITEISDEMSVRSKTLVSEDVVWFALDQLNKEGLLTDGEKIEQHFSGISRRDLVRKIGFASVIALPLVGAIVAPNAVSAQSACIAPGVCIAANTEICAGCAPGSILMLQFYMSTDGSCTSAGGTIPAFVCPPGGAMTTVDVATF